MWLVPQSLKITISGGRRFKLKATLVQEHSLRFRAKSLEFMHVCVVDVVHHVPWIHHQKDPYIQTYVNWYLYTDVHRCLYTRNEPAIAAPYCGLHHSLCHGHSLRRDDNDKADEEDEEDDGDGDDDDDDGEEEQEEDGEEEKGEEGDGHEGHHGHGDHDVVSVAV